MAGHHQGAEAQNRGERVDKHRIRGRGTDSIGTRPLQTVVHDVHAVVDSDAENERNTDQIRRIQIDAHKPHEPERLGHADRQGQGGEQAVGDAAEVEPEHGEDHHERIDRRLLVAPLHLKRRFIGLQRVAGGAGIDAADLFHEPFQRAEVPDVTAAVDLEQVPAVLADEPVDEARRQVVEPGRFGIGDGRESVETREQIARRLLLEGSQRLEALVGPQTTQRFAGPLQMPGRPQAAGPLCRLALRPGERLTQAIEPVDRDLRWPLRQRGQTALDPLDDRPLQLLVDRQERGDLVDPLHGGELRQLLLAGQQFLAGVGDREGIPDALITFGEQLLFNRHALESLGLHVEQVVVVVEFMETGGDGHGRRHRRQRHEPRMPGHRRQPFVHGNRRGNPVSERATIDDRHDRRQHEQFRRAAEQDAAAGDHAQFRDAHEAREGRAEECHRCRDRAGEDAWADGCAGLEQRLLAGEPAPPHLEIAADVVGAVVDADADHGDGERHAENIQVAHARGGPGEGPGHADDEHAVGHQRVPHAAEAGDDHDDHGHERETAGPDHRLLAGPHLVVFHHRQAGEADRDVGMAGSDEFDEAAKFVSGGGRTGEAFLRLRQSQEHEAETALLGEEVLAGEIAERGE